jgi:uncharacterized membrane protein YphA (DoxX/SURF4 family)
MPLDPALALTAALLLAMIFGVAGAAKLRAADRFAGVVENYRLLPQGLVRPVALALSVIELLLAPALLVPGLQAPATAMATLLLVTFAAAMAINLRRGRSGIDCGCAIGLLKERISWPLVGRNLMLALAAASLAVADSSERPLAWLDWFSVAAGTSCGLLLYAAAGRLFGLAPATFEGAA